MARINKRNINFRILLIVCLVIAIIVLIIVLANQNNEEEISEDIFALPPLETELVADENAVNDNIDRSQPLWYVSDTTEISSINKIPNYQGSRDPYTASEKIVMQNDIVGSIVLDALDPSIKDQIVSSLLDFFTNSPPSFVYQLIIVQPSFVSNFGLDGNFTLILFNQDTSDTSVRYNVTYLENPFSMNLELL